MQRLYAYLLVVKYVQCLAELQSKDQEQDAKAETLNYEVSNYEPVDNTIAFAHNRTYTSTQLTTTYTYDYENRLIRITLPLGITAEYKYDPFGRRIEKNISNQITVKYLYDNEDIIMEYATVIPTNTTITTKYIHGPGIDEPLSMLRNNKTYYYHADALGSITKMTDQNGNTAQTIRYDSFGNIKSISNPFMIQPYAYTGREYDMESGFYYLRNRYYDPRTGRFISKDPIGYAGGDVNLFRYVGNNAVNFTDPNGEFLAVPIAYGILGAGTVLAAYLATPEGQQMLRKLIETIQVPTTPKPSIDMSNTPQACRLRYEACKAGCEIRCESTISSISCKSKCFIAFIGCLASNY